MYLHRTCKKTLQSSNIDREDLLDNELQRGNVLCVSAGWVHLLQSGMFLFSVHESTKESRLKHGDFERPTHLVAYFVPCETNSDI